MITLILLQRAFCATASVVYEGTMEISTLMG